MSGCAAEQVPELDWPGVRFSDAEYGDRLARFQVALGAMSLDGAVIADERTTWYLTGFGDVAPIGSRARPRILVVGRAGEPTFFVHESTAVTVREMTWIDDVRPYEPLGGAPVASIAQCVAELGGERIGLELGGQLRSELSAGEIHALTERIHPTAVDVAPAVWRVRAVKSAAEIERIRRACELTTRAYARVFDQLAEGVTERQVQRLTRETILAEGADDAWAIAVLGRGDYVRVDGVPRSRRAASGDLIFIDCGANVGGYWADFSRAGVVGGPSDEQCRYQEQILEATRAGVEAVRPGATVSDVALASGRVMERYGLEFSSRAGRIGHGLGMLVTEPPDVAVNDSTPIEPGMVLTIEPGVIRDSGIFHAEENVVATTTGVETLSLAPTGLVRLG
jgi:Xaa-Pro aminopeptidase